MRTPIVTPTGVRDLTRVHGSRNQATGPHRFDWKVLDGRGDRRDDIAVFFCRPRLQWSLVY